MSLTTAQNLLNNRGMVTLSLYLFQPDAESYIGMSHYFNVTDAGSRSTSLTTTSTSISSSLYTAAITTTSTSSPTVATTGSSATAGTTAGDASPSAAIIGGAVGGTLGGILVVGGLGMAFWWLLLKSRASYGAKQAENSYKEGAIERQHAQPITQSALFHTQSRGIHEAA